MGVWRGHGDWSTTIAAVKAAIDRRLLLALTMIAVAALGAYVAYETGANELRGAQLERELAQSHLLALTEHQRLLDLRETNVEFRTRIRAAEARGNAYLDSAKAPGQPALNVEILSLQAQEEFAAARALQPLVRATRTMPGGEVGGDERNFERRLARHLARHGIEVDASGGNLWGALNGRIEEAHDNVRTLALSVLLFVTSLVMFTFADLSQRVYRARQWYVAGLVVAAIGVAAVLHADPALWARLLLPLAVPLTVFAVVVLRVVRRRATPIGTAYHVEPSGIELHAFPGEPMHSHRGPGQSARRVVRLIALTVLFSTFAGFLYSRTTTESGEAAHQALEREIEMHSRSTQRQSSMLTRIHDLAQYEEDLARYVAATQRASYLSRRAEGAAAILASAEARALYGAVVYEDLGGTMAKARRETLDLRRHADLGVDADPAFPQRIVRRMAVLPASENHRESLALWDTFNRKSLASNEHAAAFLATLTMFAVALCLFGQAFNMSRGLAAQALLLAGKCLVALGVAYGLATFAIAVEPRLGRVFQPPDDAVSASACDVRGPALDHLTEAESYAAREYANAHALLSDARSPEDYLRAVRAFSCVVALRPESALVRLDYVNAVERAGLAQSNESFARAPTKEVLQEMQRSMKAALEDLQSMSGGRGDNRAPAALLGSLGRYTLLLALEQGERSGVAESIDYLRQAEEKSGRAVAMDRVRILLNLSLALRAARNDIESDRYLKEALDLGAARNKRLAARSISDLEILAMNCMRIASKDQCSTLAAKVQEAKQEIVKGAWSEKPGEPAMAGDTRRPSIEQPTIEVYPDVVRWRGQVVDVGPQDRVAVVWYEFDDHWQAWRVLYGISDAIPYSELKQAGRWITRSYLKATGFERCLGGTANRRYRAEFYVNGGRTATTEIDVPAGENVALRSNELDLALCHPAGWKRVELPAHSRSDGLLVRGLQSGAGTSPPAVFLFTLYAPIARTGEADPAWPIERARAALVEMEVLDEMAGSPVVHDPAGRNCDAAIAKAAAVYVAWATSEGVRHIGIALPGAASPEQLCAVLDSMTNRFPRETEAPVE